MKLVIDLMELKSYVRNLTIYIPLLFMLWANYKIFREGPDNVDECFAVLTFGIDIVIVIVSLIYIYSWAWC